MWRASMDGGAVGADSVLDEVVLRSSLGLNGVHGVLPPMTYRLQVRDLGCGRHGLNGLTKPFHGRRGAKPDGS